MAIKTKKIKWIGVLLMTLEIYTGSKPEDFKNLREIVESDLKDFTEDEIFYIHNNALGIDAVTKTIIF